MPYLYTQLCSGTDQTSTLVLVHTSFHQSTRLPANKINTLRNLMLIKSECMLTTYLLIKVNSAALKRIEVLTSLDTEVRLLLHGQYTEYLLKRV